MYSKQIENPKDSIEPTIMSIALCPWNKEEKEARVEEQTFYKTSSGARDLTVTILNNNNTN